MRPPSFIVNRNLNKIGVVFLELFADLRRAKQAADNYLAYALLIRWFGLLGLKLRSLPRLWNITPINIFAPAARYDARQPGRARVRGLMRGRSKMGRGACCVAPTHRNQDDPS